MTDLGQVYACVEGIVRDHGHVDCVINDAGVGSIATIEEISYDEFGWVFRIVGYGVLYGTRAFLPYLKERPDARIVNISSVNGFASTPTNGLYCLWGTPGEGFESNPATKIERNFAPPHLGPSRRRKDRHRSQFRKLWLRVEVCWIWEDTSFLNSSEDPIQFVVDGCHDGRIGGSSAGQRWLLSSRSVRRSIWPKPMRPSISGMPSKSARPESNNGWSARTLRRATRDGLMQRGLNCSEQVTSLNHGRPRRGRWEHRSLSPAVPLNRLRSAAYAIGE